MKSLLAVNWFSIGPSVSNIGLCHKKDTMAADNDEVIDLDTLPSNYANASCSPVLLLAPSCGNLL